MNEYTPWIEKGMTELDYFKDRYLDTVMKLERAVEVIKFYGDKEHWYMNDGDMRVITQLDFSKVNRPFDTQQCGGKRAREFLAGLDKTNEQ
jgi:hypothetical protein